jgi:hypothetical protein
MVAHELAERLTACSVSCAVTSAVLGRRDPHRLGRQGQHPGVVERILADLVRVGAAMVVALGRAVEAEVARARVSDVVRIRVVVDVEVGDRRVAADGHEEPRVLVGLTRGAVAHVDRARGEGADRDEVLHERVLARPDDRRARPGVQDVVGADERGRELARAVREDADRRARRLRVLVREERARQLQEVRAELGERERLDRAAVVLEVEVRVDDVERRPAR